MKLIKTKTRGVKFSLPKGTVSKVKSVVNKGTKLYKKYAPAGLRRDVDRGRVLAKGAGILYGRARDAVNKYSRNIPSLPKGIFDNNFFKKDLRGFTNKAPVKKKEGRRSIYADPPARSNPHPRRPSRKSSRHKKVPWWLQGIRIYY